MQATGSFELVQLANGSYSVHALAYGETFHPVVGPVAEAEALYVRQLKLPERLAHEDKPFVVWDVGLGAAANALAVLRATRMSKTRLRLISFDQTIEPLRFALAHSLQLGYLAGYEDRVGELLRREPAFTTEFADGNHLIDWELRIRDFPTFLASPAAEQLPKPHAILFDAYSPASNPEMWTLPLFARLYSLLSPTRACALATYSRSTMLRVTLLLDGFFVGKGHATGEKEETTIASNCRSLIDQPLDRRWLRRAQNSTSAEPLRGGPYRQARLSPQSWAGLLAHPQFQ